MFFKRKDVPAAGCETARVERQGVVPGRAYSPDPDAVTTSSTIP